MSPLPFIPLQTTFKFLTQYSNNILKFKIFLMFRLKMPFPLINFINRNIAAVTFLLHLALQAIEITVAFRLQPYLATCHLFALGAQLHLSSSTICNWACQPLLNLKSHLAAKEASILTLTNLIGLALSVRSSVPKKTVLTLVQSTCLLCYIWASY